MTAENEKLAEKIMGQFAVFDNETKDMLLLMAEEKDKRISIDGDMKKGTAQTMLNQRIKIAKLEAEVKSLGMWKCAICGSPNRHDKEIHTFICNNPKCGYREWYPERRDDNFTIYVRNLENENEQLIDDMKSVRRRWNIPEDESKYIAKCRSCGRPTMEITESYCLECGLGIQNQKALASQEKELLGMMDYLKRIRDNHHPDAFVAAFDVQYKKLRSKGKEVSR